MKLNLIRRVLQKLKAGFYESRDSTNPLKQHSKQFFGHRAARLLCCSSTQLKPHLQALQAVAVQSKALHALQAGESIHVHGPDYSL